MAPKLLRVDKNGTKYWADSTCPKCGGSGYISAYYYNAQGVCFLCGGNGYHETHWKEYTPEYQAKLTERRLAKARKAAPEKNAKFLRQAGFSEDGRAWIVTGNTYEIKDELKAAGCKWHNLIGWHFDHAENGFSCFELSIDEITTKSRADEYIWEDYDFIAAYIKDLKVKNAPKTGSEYVGEVGSKLELAVTLKRVFTYETHYSYAGELAYIYKFADAEGNTITWKTSKFFEIGEGWTGLIAGTVKEHSEYRGDKQTVLTRCKLKEPA